MPISPARTTAYEILRRVESSGDFAVDLLQRPQVSALKDADRRLATEIVMGVLRWKGELDFQVTELSGKPADRFDAEVLTILRMGVYQLRFLERVPKRAVVDDAVELTKRARKRSAAGLVNAVLRKFTPPETRLLSCAFEDCTSADRQSIRRAFPEWLLKRWERIAGPMGTLGADGALRLAHASLQIPRITLRVVNAHDDVERVRSELAADGTITASCAHAGAHGLTVEIGQVQATRAYREGSVVIQDEASQLVPELVSPVRGQRILDVCAAPGLKSGQLAQLLEVGTLMACDRSAARSQTMRKLLPRWVPDAVSLSFVRLDAAVALPFSAKFDRVLVDAPCSGTGTLRRNPEIKWRLRPEDIKRLAETQTSMLRNSLGVLAPGGRLVYATCSLEPEETEGVVERVLATHPEFRRSTSEELGAQYPHLSSLFDSQGYFRTRPGEVPMDGFTAAVIVRN